MAQLAPETAIELETSDQMAISSGDRFTVEKILKDGAEKNWAAVLKSYEIISKKECPRQIFELAIEAAIQLEQSRLALKIFSDMNTDDRINLNTVLMLQIAKHAQMLNQYEISEKILLWIREKEGLPKLASLESKLEQQFSSTTEMDRFYYRMETHSEGGKLLSKASFDDWLMYGFLCMSKGKYDEAQSVLVKVKTETVN